MTQHHGVERIVTDWLVESAQPRVPDFFDSLLAETARTRQRPAWTFLERWIPMATLARPRLLLAPLPWRTIGLLAALLLLLAATIVLVGSQPLVPPPFGRAANGLVAYSMGGDIYTADSSTGTSRAIVGGPAEDSGPRWSRDGRRIVFVRAAETPGTGRLFVVDADGGGLRALTQDPILTFEAGEGEVYDFSPDGRRVLYVTRIAGIRSLGVVPVEGGPPATIDVGRPVHIASWRPPSGDEIPVPQRRPGRTRAVRRQGRRLPGSDPRRTQHRVQPG